MYNILRNFAINFLTAVLIVATWHYLAPEALCWLSPQRLQTVNAAVVCASIVCGVLWFFENFEIGY